MKESRTLTMEGDLVRIERTVVEKEISSTQFLDELSKAQTLETGPLPRDCAAYFRWQDKATGEPAFLYMLEREPGLQKVRFRSEPDERHERGRLLDLELSWPRTLWFIECQGAILKDVYLTVIEAPFREQYQATPLFRLPMPNQHTPFGHLCMGDLTVSSSASMAQRIDELALKIRESVWNTDLMPGFEDTGIDGLEDWAEKSAGYPEFYREIHFHPHWARTVADLLRRLRGEEQR